MSTIWSGYLCTTDLDTGVLSTDCTRCSALCHLARLCLCGVTD